MKKEHNYYIDMMRIVWTLYIVMMHMRDALPINIERLRGGYIGVEFFYMVSGYYIANAAKKRINTKVYLRNRLTRLYPAYFLGFIFIAIREVLCVTDWTEKWKVLNHTIWYSLMVQNLGFTMEYRFNDYLWYITYLIFFGTLIYYFLNCKSKSFVNKTAIVFCVIFYVLSWGLNGTINGTNASLRYVKILPIPAYRSIAAMFLGVLCYNVVEKRNLNNVSNAIKSFCVVFLSIISILLQVFYPYSLYEIIVMFSFFVCIWLSNSICFPKMKINKIIAFLGEKTYIYYCAQATAFRFIGDSTTVIEVLTKVLIVAVCFEVLICIYNKLGKVLKE